MFLILIAAIVLGLIFLPQFWVRHVIQRHAQPDESIPGTGAELARHLIERFQITGVKVERTEDGQDHYDPGANAVRLSPLIYDGKSVSAIAIAAHEVGHAIQYHRRETVTQLRQAYTPLAQKLERFAVMALMLIPLITLLARVPHVALLTALAGILMMFAAAIVQAMILPMEWDASFNKALPILSEGNYVRPDQQAAARSVLRAAAMTYVAAALVDALRLWRWLAILRGIAR